jgi:hypothetical protein
VVGESLGSQSMKNPYPGDKDAVAGLLHDVLHFPPTSSLDHSQWQVAIRGSLADVVVGAEVMAHAAELAVLAHDRQTTWGCRAHGPR